MSPLIPPGEEKGSRFLMPGNVYVVVHVVLFNFVQLLLAVDFKKSTY